MTMDIPFAEILLLLFLVITFLQSGLDKLTDWKGNLGWLKEHLAKTPIGNSVPMALGLVMVLELGGGILCALGLGQLLISGETLLAFYGAIICGAVLLMLLLGQRLAKDYEGARTIVVYLIPTILLVYLLQL